MQLSQLDIPRKTLEGILDFLPYPFLLTRSVNNIYHHIYFNSQFLDEIGYTLEEVPGIEEWFQKAYPDSQYREQIQAKWMEMINEALTKGRSSVTARARIYTRSKGYKWFEVKSSLTVEGYQFVSFINIDDVLSKEVQLERANENKNKMLSILSHDLRSPMISLYSLTQMAMNKTLSPEEFATLAVQVKEKAAQALELLDTTVRWTKANFENVQLIKQPVSVKNIVERIIETDNGYRDKSISLSIKIDSTHQPVTEQGIFTIIVRNLISNAVKFTPESGLIEIKTWEDEGGFYLSVKDSGVGMEQSLVEAILNDRYSPSVGTMRERGSGIGLTLCRDLLKKIDGTLNILTSPGRGTTMQVYLKQ